MLNITNITDGRVTLDLNGWVGEFHRELDALLSDMFQLCSAAEEKRYSNDTVNRVGLVGFLLPENVAFGETAPQRAARNLFIGAMSKFNGFLDRLIASRRIAKDGMPVTKTLNGLEEISQYVVEFIEQTVATVARDQSLSFPKKMEHFTGVDPSITDMAINYNALRNALEHHHDLPKRDLKVTVRRISFMVDDQEVTELPKLVLSGQTLGVKMVSVDKTFPANRKIILEPEDGSALIFTLRHIITVAIFQWHVRNPPLKSI